MSILNFLFGSGKQSMKTITKRFKQRPTGDRYTIEFRLQAGGTYDMFCTKHPHNPFSTDVNDCHLWPSNKVCVARGREPRTLDRAMAIASYWMEYYSSYIRTGEKIQPKMKINVNN